VNEPDSHNHRSTKGWLDTLHYYAGDNPRDLAVQLKRILNDTNSVPLFEAKPTQDEKLALVTQILTSVLQTEIRLATHAILRRLETLNDDSGYE
jgi:hypothetical protein